MTVHLRRKNRIRRNSHGIPTASMGGAATAIASSTASQVAVLLRLWPAPARSRAASLAARNGVATAPPTRGNRSALSPAELRFSEIPVAPLWTWVPTVAKVAIAWCTARPTRTQTVNHAAISRSLTSWAVNRAGVVA